jgi:hypothetical protein
MLGWPQAPIAEQAGRDGPQCPAAQAPLPAFLHSAQARAQKKHPGRQLPLVIMTSDDTHARTQHLLEEWLHFGADPQQIRLLKQASTLSPLCTAPCRLFPRVCLLECSWGRATQSAGPAWQNAW